MERVREELYLEEQAEAARQKEIVRIRLLSLLKKAKSCINLLFCQFKRYDSANVK